MIRRVVITAILMVLLLILGQFLLQKRAHTRTEEQATILLERVENISKLMVVEGHFSEVYTYKKEESLFQLIPVEKKMVVIVNATAYVGYDLEQMNIRVDAEKKQLVLGNWPKPEVIIEPDVEYYDIQQSKIFPLNAADLNRVNKRAIDLIEGQVRASNLEAQAKERVQTVLENLMFTSSSMGWSVVYDTPQLNSLD